MMALSLSRCFSAAPRTLRCASTCPVKGSASVELRKTATLHSDDDRHPKLVEVPSLPYIGSMIPQYSGTPDFRPENWLRAWPDMRRKFGDFYKFGMPGMGATAREPTVYMMHDPVEYSKLLRSEGSHPSGLVEHLWAAQIWLKEHGDDSRAINIIRNGPEWKRIRRFLQTDLLNPISASRFVPGIAEAARHASKGAGGRSGDFLDYLNECAFDMGYSFLLGRNPRIADSTFESDPDDLQHCREVVALLGLTNNLTSDLVSKFLKVQLGVESAKYKKFSLLSTKVKVESKKRLAAVMKKQKNGTLSDEEAASYVSQAIDRQALEDGNNDPITIDEAMELSRFLLTAIIDTTSGKLSWHILHFAQNLDVQQRVRQEIKTAVAGTNGRFTVDTLNSSTTPLLMAAIRESHRMANPIPLMPIKIIKEDIIVHGTTIPAGSVCGFDGYSQGMDPDIVDEPNEFRPERFLSDAVEARKGTKAEVIDHVLLSSPFSQGARRCPGSRVARSEVNILLAQLLLDWEITTDVVDVPYMWSATLAPKFPELKITPVSQEEPPLQRVV